MGGRKDLMFNDRERLLFRLQLVFAPSNPRPVAPLVRMVSARCRRIELLLAKHRLAFNLRSRD